MEMAKAGHETWGIDPKAMYGALVKLRETITEPALRRIIERALKRIDW
jgi:hypothetical protein